jgi:CMP-N,N'-diacetyllegionaminic acid synthase
MRARDISEIADVIAIIPARGGSKGIPGKNIVDFHGHPLIAWSIMAAMRSSLCRRIIVSTDCPNIAAAARRYGAETPSRPAEISGDDAPTDLVVRHVLEHHDCETALLLQPTSPLRTAADIRQCYALHLEHRRPVVSFKPAKPWLFVDKGDHVSRVTEPVASRQQQSMLMPNGAVYVARADHLLDGGSWYDDPVPFLMPEERSIDIDTPLDLLLARTVMSETTVH